MRSKVGEWGRERENAPFHSLCTFIQIDIFLQGQLKETKSTPFLILYYKNML